MNHQKEAKIFGKFLLGKNVNEYCISLYADAMEKLQFNPDEKDIKIEKFIEKHPIFLPLVDGGLALVKSNSVVRKKTFTMLAILETIPEYSDKFLPKNFSFWYLFKIAGSGIRGVFRGIFGMILIKIL